jgi:protein-disulfide isomerase
MLRKISLLFLLATLTTAAQTRPSESAPAQPQIEKKVETFLRNLFAWGPEYQIKIGPLKDAPMPGYYEISVNIAHAEQSDTGTIYASKDGHFIFRGEVDDTTKDPFAKIKASLHLDGNPSRGPENATVTVVDFSDFECPHCAELQKILKVTMAKYPQVRFVFKDFPLPQHPWAMTAALAGRCAYMQSPDAFWKVHDSIFENQQTITPDNAWEKMQQFAATAGLQPDAFRACMASPEAKQSIDANIADGTIVKIANTPTLYINGRPLIGGSQESLDQYITYELTPPATTQSVPRNPN